MNRFLVGLYIALLVGGLLSILAGLVWLTVSPYGREHPITTTAAYIATISAFAGIFAATEAP